MEQLAPERRSVPPPRRPDEWPALRHVFHMAAYERSIALPSMRQWQGGSPVSLEGLDEDATWNGGQGQDPADRLAVFRQVRSEQIALLIIVQLAGKRHVRANAVIEHRGRRSGRVYATPVAARPTADGFLVPMAFGEQADWFRNVQAVGECVIRWNGAAYHVTEPELMDWATARQALGRVERMLAPLFS